MAKYTPSFETADLLRRAYQYVVSAPYSVTARWVFYRLLQDGNLTTKADYKRLLGLLSKARKRFYGQWTPFTLADKSRGALIRGSGFNDGPSWLKAMVNMSCNLDRWANQDTYIELWFEAAAMQAQFEHYADPNISLLAFHGDVSIPAKWDATTRLLRRWIDRQDRKIVVLYYGDLDTKGIQIPNSARRDIIDFVGYALQTEYHLPFSVVEETFSRFQQAFTFRRVGINQDQIDTYDIPENPERPGTYQWEGLDNVAAEALIGEANSYINLDAFQKMEDSEAAITDQYRDHVLTLTLEE